MTADEDVNDVINPVTALAFAEDKSCNLRFLLAGEGPYLKVFDDRTGLLTATRRIFETEAIHGIISIDASTGYHSSSTEILIWGGRYVRLGVLRHGAAADSSLVEIELKPVLRLEDWILAGCFASDLNLEHGPQQPHSGTRDAVVLTAHNVAYAIRQDQEGQPSFKRIVAGPDSMLYSAHLEWNEPSGRVLVASGTVFGEIFVWSFAGTAVRADAEQLAESWLHYSFAGHEGSVFGVRISPDLSEQGLEDVRRLLASCSDDRTIRLWDISDLDTDETKSDLGSQKAMKSTPSAMNKDPKSSSTTGCVAIIMGHASRIWDIHFLISDEGISVLSFGEDSTTQAWQLTPNEFHPNVSDANALVLRHKHTYAYHSGKSIWASALVQCQDGTQTVCTGGADGRIVQYDVSDEHGSTNERGLTSKWTMQDIAVQLGEIRTSSDKADAPSVPKKTLCETLFDVLAGPWTIERTIQSALPTSPSGTFSGEAQFNSRPATAPDFDKEYLYIENGNFTTDQGLAFTATRRYVYRYRRSSDSISAWFVKPDDNTAVDYLFHEIQLHDSNTTSTNCSLPNGVIKASSYHLCVKDHYTPDYVWQITNGRLHDWKLVYGVKGPEKDYVAEASYARHEDSVRSLISSESSNAPQATEAGGRATSDSCIEQDSLKSYAIMTDGSVLVTTVQGRVLIASLISSAGNRAEIENGEVDMTTAKWKLVGQYASLKSSSIVTQGVGSNLIFLSGNDGIISFYSRSTEAVLRLIHLERKLAFLYAQKVDDGPPESQLHFILAVCLGFSAAFVYAISDSDLTGDDVTRQPIRLALPAQFVVTSSCYLPQLRLWTLGSRNGVLAFYDGATAQHDSTLEPWGIFKDVHREETITVIQCLPRHSENQSAYILTAGRDGHYAVHEVVITTPRTSNQQIVVNLQTVHRSTPTFGPNIEGAAFDNQTRDLVLWGFRSKEFVVWNATKDKETMSVDCGGAHRSWCYSPHSNGSDGGTFVWTKASICNMHLQAQASHRILSSGGHGREIKAMAISPVVAKHNGAATQYIATGAEDTTIKIWSYNEPTQESDSPLRCLGTFRKHTTGIQQLRWSADGSMLFSAAGCEEFFVWRVQSVPFLGVGAVCDAVCPKVTEDGDLRVMDFAIAENDPSSDGHIAFWSLKYSLDPPSAKGLHISSTAAVHQNSIKTMFAIPLDTTGLDALIITGGDDGALGITRRVQSESSARPLTSTLLIPKAHAAAVNAVEYLLRIPENQSCQTHVFVSSGNDQRLKTWVVQIDSRDSSSNPIESVSVRLHSDQHTSVADLSSLSATPGTKGMGVMVAGIGMECFADLTSGISSPEPNAI
ncbi:MAG: hypothetical protein Q9168_004872 [Polycauliona sp. 1 TL-2023]